MESGKMAAIDSPGSRRALSKHFMSLLDTESGCLAARKLMRAATVRERSSSRDTDASRDRMGAVFVQRIGKLVYSLHGEENRSVGARRGGDLRAGGVCRDGGSGSARRRDRVRPAGAGGDPRVGVSGAGGGHAGDHDAGLGILPGAPGGDSGVALGEARRAQGGLPAGGREPERGSGGATAQGADSQAASGSFLWPRAGGDTQLPERTCVCAGGVFWDPGRYLRRESTMARRGGGNGGDAGILTRVSWLPLSERRGGGLGAGGGVAGAVGYCCRSPRGFPCLISS